MDREASVHGSVLQEFHAYDQEGNDNDNASATASGINIISDDVNGDMMRSQAGEQGHGAFVFPADANMASAHRGPSSSSVLPWPLALLNSSSNSNLSPNQFSMPPPIFRDQERFFPSLPPLPPPPPPPPAFYHDQLQFARRASAGIQFGNDGGGLGSSSSDPLGLAGLYSAMGPESFLRGGGLMSSSPLFGGLHAEFGKLTPQEIMDAKALAASKSHSEAERRRRERINAHLARLRSLLPSTTKTDKASLLAEVIQHVKELKRQTSEIAEESPLPTEADELTVDAASDEEGRFLVRASLCCDDRSDLLPDLIKALKALKLRTLKAEITTLGGRVKNVLLITREDDGGGAEDHHQAASAPEQSIASIQDALKAVMERTSSSAEEPSPATTAAAAAAAAAGSIKRQRTANVSGVLEHRSI